MTEENSAEGGVRDINGETPEESGVVVATLREIFTSPLHMFLVAVIAVLIYKIFKQHAKPPPVVSPPQLPKLKKRDFTVEELRQYDGTSHGGRVLVAVNGKVFDVTKGKHFYGPGGTYSAFGGRDASRGLATFQVSKGKDEYDDLSDLDEVQMDQVREWEIQFTERYDYVGKLLKPGQEPTSYSDDEEEDSTVQEKSKDE